MLTSRDKQGGADFSLPPAKDFSSCLEQCELFDMGFVGPKFTWRRGTLLERLDRAVINEDWLLRFPESVNRHLPRVKSDHRPILVCTDFDSTSNRLPCPFRFNAAWLSHEDFRRFLDREWRPGCGAPFSLQVLQDRLKEWNKNTFGNIFQQKRKLEGRLGILEKQNEEGGFAVSLAEEQSIRAELEVTLWQEEVLWL
ncbi:hypothetical protein LINGRAHAP2_LOCUS1046 [Linum grandiflorum]